MPSQGMARASQPRKRKYRTFEEIKEIVAEFERSNMTQRAFAKSRKIPLATLTLWLRRVRAASAQSVPSNNPPMLIEVRGQPISTPPACIIELANGHCLTVPEGFDHATSQQLNRFDQASSGDQRLWRGQSRFVAFRPRIPPHHRARSRHSLLP